MSEILSKNFKTINLKSFDVNEEGNFIAFVSTENIDRVNDIVIAGGIKSMFPIPLLLEHKEYKQIGIITKGEIDVFDKEKDIKGYKIYGTLDLKGDIISDVGLEERYFIRNTIKKNNKGFQLSIGYKTLKEKQQENKNILEEINLLECSFVKNPANLDTYFVEMKNNDEILNIGAKKLKAYYEKEEQEKEELKNNIKKYNDNIINTTVKTKDFIESISNYYSINEKIIDIIYKKTIEFNKRATDFHKKEEEKKEDYFDLILKNKK